MGHERITVNPAQMGGLPCIRGLRIPIATVVGMVAGGMTEAEILQALPDLEPADIRQALRFAAEAELEQARKKLVKYRTMARQFEAKYKVDFQTFRQQILASEPAFEAEQDYFDWELAVTGIDDMQEEIARLNRSWSR